MNFIKYNKAFLFILLITTCLFKISAQEIQKERFSKSAIKTGFGFMGFNFSNQEEGMGFVYQIGYQQSLGKKDRFRFNPNITFGSMSTQLQTDMTDQFYNVTSFATNIYYDVLKSKSVSLPIYTGLFFNYTRGLRGTGGDFDAPNQPTSSGYISKGYYGFNAGMGLRISNPESRFAYEIRPLNFEIGNREFVLYYFMFGLEIKLEKY